MITVEIVRYINSYIVAGELFSPPFDGRYRPVLCPEAVLWFLKTMPDYALLKLSEEELPGAVRLKPAGVCLVDTDPAFADAVDYGRSPGDLQIYGRLQELCEQAAGAGNDVYMIVDHLPDDQKKRPSRAEALVNVEKAASVYKT